MKTTIVVLTLFALVVAATVASAGGRGYSAYVQKAWRQQQAEQMKADQQFEKAFKDVAKGMPATAVPDLGTGWGTAAAAGSRTRGPSQVGGWWTTCPGY